MEKLEYEIKYPNLDAQQLVSDRQLFDYGTVAAHIKEYEKGFKVKKISKTYRTGTLFTYYKISDEEDLKEYEDLLMEIVKNYNDKYKVNMTREEFNKY